MNFGVLKEESREISHTLSQLDKPQSSPELPRSSAISLAHIDLSQRIEEFEKKERPRRFGNLLLFWYDSTNNPRIVIGSNWILFLFAFVVFVLFYIVIFIFVWDHTFLLLNIFGIALGFIQLLLYLITSLKNPGVQLRKPRNSSMPSCEFCGCLIVKGTRQRHCFICDACFIGYDHHCPWTSKCIGEENKKYFYLFLFFTFFVFMYLVILMSFYH